MAFACSCQAPGGLSLASFFEQYPFLFVDFLVFQKSDINVTGRAGLLDPFEAVAANTGLV